MAENYFKATGDAMSDSQVDIETCFGQQASLRHTKTLEGNVHELVKKLSYPFCEEIEVIHKNRSMQAYLIRIIPKEVIFPINGVHTEK